MGVKITPRHNENIERALKRLKKALITLFIVVSLSTQALSNLRVGYLRPQADAGLIVRTTARVYNYARAGVAAFGIYTGTNTYWRLFSPINKVYWWHTAEALYPDGSVAWHGLYDHAARRRGEFQSRGDRYVL